MSKDEIFDIYNSVMQKIGTATRQEAHAQGLWHQTFQCWVIRTSNREAAKLLFQLRHPDKDTFPNLFDISCAGHLLSGEDVEDGVRELQEELGLDVSFQDLLPCGLFAEEDIISGTLIDREFCHVFLYQCSKSLFDYSFQTSEITGLFFINWRDFRKLVYGETASIVAEGLVLVGEGEKKEVIKEVWAKDFVPHPRAYYDLLFDKIQNAE